MRIHLLVNIHRADAVEAAASAVAWMNEHGVESGADRDAAPKLNIPAIPAEHFADCDLVVSFGGDGTLIRAAHLCSERGTPILGVYYGRFGFVTQCDGPELGSCLSAFMDGLVRIEARMMLQTDLIRNGSVVATVHSLNETVIQRAVTVPMLTFEVSVDGHLLTTYPADGVIVATPTGSTAYNLSAGGPIMDPRINALMITAVAPHTLSARPLVIGPDCTIHVGVSAEGEAVISSDGVTRLHLLSGDEIAVCRSPRITNLVSVEKDDFLIKLGERLFWQQGLPVSQ